MTPELKKACEVVFQEHKASAEPISWNKDSFRGRLPFGLSALAKQTLEKKNIIQTTGPVKKSMTMLNPLVVTAASFEEADEWAQAKTPQLVAETTVDPLETTIFANEDLFANTNVKDIVKLLKVRGTPLPTPARESWWTRPILSYFIWLASAAISGALITFLLGLLV
jgi:hypothetical protein